jgi:ribosomal protein L37E
VSQSKFGAKGNVFLGEDGTKLFLVRCPKCGVENYAPAVSSGICVLCGYKAKESDVNAR